MSTENFLLLFKIQVAFYLVVALLALVKYNVRDGYVRAVGMLFFASAFADVGGFIGYEYKINPNYFSSAYNILTFPLFSWIYYSVTGKRNKTTLIFVAALYCLFGIANLFFIQKQAVNSYTATVSSIIMIIYCLYYFYWLMREMPTIYLHRLPMFWINSAFMIYFSGNLFLHVFTSYLTNVLKVMLFPYWWVHNVLGIVHMLMIILALWIDLRNIKAQSV